MSEYEGILESLEDIHKKLDRLLVKGSVKGFKVVEHEREVVRNSPGFKPYERPKEEETVTDIMVDAINTATKEEVSQDLAQVLLFNETPKAFLAVKHGFQVWVAKSHLESADGYDLGNTYDLKVKEKSKWVLKKLNWKPFEVFKD